MLSQTLWLDSIWLVRRTQGIRLTSTWTNYPTFPARPTTSSTPARQV